MIDICLISKIRLYKKGLHKNKFDSNLKIGKTHVAIFEYLSGLQLVAM
jgi:hypothetical protein